MNEYTDILKNTWGYLAGVLVWVADHASFMMAFTLFVLQVIYQVYRIRKIRKEMPKDEQERSE